tara:strand:+ start:735 stop:1430 length:696 start_codon:yes stop_codon:yes gene_type:complete
MYTYRNNIILALFACSTLVLLIIYFNPNSFQESKKNSVKLPNDIRWVVKSNEYDMLCEKIYAQAAEQTKNLYSNNRQAIIMDLDETVLDNSKYQVENFNKGETFNMQSWAKWVNREDADLVPGVKEYINLIRELGIQLIFISNRMDERVEATKQNMKKLNIYDENDIYLLRLNKEDKKDIRRKEVFNGTNRMAEYGPFDVILYIGDAMGDFPKDNNNSNKYILPNPMYGKW